MPVRSVKLWDQHHKLDESEGMDTGPFLVTNCDAHCGTAPAMFGKFSDSYPV